MKILLNNHDLNGALVNVSNLGFIPTMGGLHKGHISLIKMSLKRCKKTIVSIFINPQQFNKKSDYKKYPRQIKQDLILLKKINVDFVYIPKIEHVYDNQKVPKITINQKDRVLCAKFRKDHFEGVIEVMFRLTKLIKPNKIFMGEKDFQQLYLVKNFISKNFKCKVVSGKTIRDKNHAALSSRNLLLKKIDLKIVGDIAQNLILFKKNLNTKDNLKKLLIIKKNELSKKFNINIDYLELRNSENLKISKVKKKSRLFIAYNFKKIRLIDNF
tara:strand:+ start:340 stop:1152 length:813 start_codon:yes stop_codon:yes gene_type:complete